MIPDQSRCARRGACAAWPRAAREEIRAARQIVIFPEGTRRPPGAKPRYLPGVAFLYAEIGLPCVPIALNSGLFWPRRSLRRYPGTVLVEVLDPIRPGSTSAHSCAPASRVWRKQPRGSSRKANNQVSRGS